MVLIRISLALLLPIGISLAAAVAAHDGHNEQATHNKAPPDAPLRLPSQRGAMDKHDSAAKLETPMSFTGRTMDWMGRVHPFAVHFPIALFPVAWIALIFARRRGDAPDVIRSLIVVAGAAASLAAILGWLEAGLAADRDWIHAAHRWLGTGLGLIGAAIAIWAWRRPASVSSRAMACLLALTTLLLLVQGWFGWRSRPRRRPYELVRPR